uniref:Uncharacterized protein n=1 Tax=Talaromyces marneffei PM1 TaxID=1077442 RepID=A0A093XJ12_TALMA
MSKINEGASEGTSRFLAFSSFEDGQTSRPHRRRWRHGHDHRLYPQSRWRRDNIPRTATPPEALNHPQVLYYYIDNKLKEFKEYTYLTDPPQILDKEAYDFIVITLDGAALKNEAGQNLVKTIGSAVRQSTARNTGIILGTVFLNIRSWFLEVSGLSEDQVALGWFTIRAYSTAAVTLPLHPPTDPELLSKASIAWIDNLGDGFGVDDSAPEVANAFAKLYNSSGVSTCGITPKAQETLYMNPIFVMYAACALLDWPWFKDIDTQGEIWRLAVAAAKEIQGLSIHGELGQQAAKTTTEASIAKRFADIDAKLLPLDNPAFNRYHHGGKVNEQDTEHLRACVAFGEGEGKDLTALKELIRRVESVS